MNSSTPANLRAEIGEERVSEGRAETRQRPDWREALGEDEFRELQVMRVGRGLFSLALNWAIVFGAFGLVGMWTNPLTILLAIFLIGGRHRQQRMY